MRLQLFTFLAASTIAAVAQPVHYEFEAASLKIDDGLFDPHMLGMKGGPGTSDPGRITWNRMPMVGLINQAYSVTADQIFGFADNPHKFTLTATFPVTTTKEQFRTMLQNLLAERVHLVLHHETRTFPGYELVLAAGGPKFQSWTPDPNVPPRIPGARLQPGQSGFDWSALQRKPPIDPHVASRQSMPDFAVALRMLQTYADNTRGDEERDQELMAALQRGSARALASPRFVDKTGLAGQFELNLDFEGAMLPRASEGGPTLPEALEKQLGLKLVKTKGVPLDVVVIDHVDKEPTEN